MKQLPLSTLIERLQSEGFSIDARTILQLQEVMHLLGREYLHTPQELYKILSPIIVKNEGEQTKFKQIFEEYWFQIHKLVVPSEGEIVAPIEDDKKLRISKKLKYTLLLLGSLFLALLAYLFFKDTTTILPKSKRPSAYFSYTPKQDIFKQDIFIGDTITFLNQSIQKEDITYQWNFGNGDSLRSQDSIVKYVYAKEKNPYYIVRLLARNKEGLDSTYIQSIFVEDSCKPQPVFTYTVKNKTTQEIYIGDTILFYNNTANKIGLRFTWDFGDSSKILASNDSIISHIYPKGGNLVAMLTAKNIVNACEKTVSSMIPVQASLTTTEMVVVPLSVWEKPVIYWWVLLLGIVLWAVVEFYFYYKARNPLSKKKEKAFKEKIKVSDKRPYAIPFPNKESAIALERDFYDLSNELRTREEGERQSLHLLATLRQTIKKGGFPTIIHKVNSKPSEYLFLIERTRANNQQYQLFEAFARLLQNEGVLIEKFIYQKDFSLCSNEKYQNGIKIETLAQNFPTHHLIIIGNGAGFFHELGTEIDKEKIDLLDRWKDKVLLTPIYAEHWTYQEKLLQAHFTLLPATMNGWLDLMEALLNEEQTNFPAIQRKYWHKHSTEIARGGLAHPQDYIKDRDWDLPMLKTYLNDPQLLAWVCAIAVYPKPTWEITLAIGEAIDRLDGDKTLLVTYANLFTIAQLPWLQSGNLPPQLREVLLTELHTQPNIERLAYQTLADLLAQLSIPENSLASREKEIQEALTAHYLGKETKQSKEKLYYLFQQGLVSGRDKLKLAAYFTDLYKLKYLAFRLTVVFLLAVASFLLMYRETTRTITKEEAILIPSSDQKAVLSEIEKNMVKVEGGSFQMGCDSKVDKCESNETQHQVSLSTFQISKYEVTQTQWEAIIGKNPSFFKNCPTCPVESVSWNEVQEFIKKLNQVSGKKYRLPTEAEWEYAARGGNKSKGYQYSGSNTPNSVAWFGENSNSHTLPVGTKTANELGLHDMSGNVWEWCNDWYGDYPTDPQTNPKGAKTGSYRVYRGGGWYIYASSLRVAYRSLNSPTYSRSVIGFRLAMD